MIKILFGILLLVILSCQLTGCQAKQKVDLKPEYLSFVGDIERDSILDNPNFKLCNNQKHLFQYFNTGEGFKYEGEKPELISKIKSEYKPHTSVANQTGYIRIRFIINCKGDAGIYRVLSSDANYEPMEFDKELVGQLIEVVKKLDGWQTITKNDNPLDYYMYLIFKIEKGQIIEILP